MRRRLNLLEYLMMAFDIVTLQVGQLQTNCYLVIDKKSNKALIIDPGDDADYIERIIADRNCKPVKIIATHGHFDHILAVTELKLAYKIPFLIHKKDEFLVGRMQDSAIHFLGISVDPPPPIDGFITQKVITIGESKLQVIETPGHTPGSICLYSKNDNVLIVGDLIFADGGVGRTDFSYSDHEELKNSLAKIFKLPPETKILPGHGVSSTISQESKFHENNL